MELSKLMGCVKRPFIPSELFRGGLIDGAWLDPSDMSTLYQDAAGTIPVTAVEQPVGLILDKSQGLILGPELVPQNYLTNPAAWSIVNGTAKAVAGRIIFTANGAGQLIVKMLTPVVLNKIVRTSLSISSFDSGIGSLYDYTSGVNVKVIDSLPTSNITSNSKTSNGAELIAFLSGGTPAAGASFSIDNLTIKEIYGNHATQSITSARPTLSARYNLLTKTEDFSDAVWIKYSTATQINASIAPDGTLSADRVWAVSGAIMTSNDGVGQIGSVNVTSNGSPYTLSFYAKADGLNYIRIREAANTGARVKINLTDGSFSGESGWNASIFTVKTSKANNGFLRIEITRTAPVTFSLSIKCGNDVGSGISEGIFIWGADLRLGTTSGPYQRVNTATDYDSVGWPRYLRFDGIDDYLNLPYMGLYANGSASVVAAKSLLPIRDNNFFLSEGSSLSSAPLYCFASLYQEAPSEGSLIRNDANSTHLDTLADTATNTFTPVKITVFVDTGTILSRYNNGAVARVSNYTREGVTSLDKTTIGALARMITTNYLQGNIYGLIITKSALSDTDRRRCEQFLASRLSTLGVTLS